MNEIKQKLKEADLVGTLKSLVLYNIDVLLRVPEMIAFTDIVNRLNYVMLACLIRNYLNFEKYPRMNEID